MKLPEVSYNTTLVPITQEPPSYFSNPSYTYKTQPAFTTYTPQPSKFDVWAGRITGLAREAAQIFQQFKTPSGQTVTYAVQPEPTTSVVASVGASDRGVGGSLQISRETLLLGGVLLAVFLFGRGRR